MFATYNAIKIGYVLLIKKFMNIQLNKGELKTKKIVCLNAVLIETFILINI
jgi:hypothetical protein